MGQIVQYPTKIYHRVSLWLKLQNNTWILIKRKKYEGENKGKENLQLLLLAASHLSP